MVEALQGQNRKITKPALEKNITKHILTWLRTQPQCYAVKTYGDIKRQGEPDIIGCYMGKAFAFEVKRPGGKLSPLQEAILDKWRKAGAVVGVVNNLKDIKEIISSIG